MQPADLRGPLRKAIEAGDGMGILEALMERSTLTPTGCWHWNHRIRADGYATYNLAGRSISVHRLSLEARLGRPLGSQAAHHTCANASCVNPDHLQPVTHRDNVAEMLARSAYVARINELEAALREVDPEHPALQVYPLAGVNRE